jgi:hypothetical protein
MSRRRLFIGIGTVTVVVAFNAPARSAGVPLFFTEQGRLFDTSDNPITDAAATFTFAIYNAATAGTPATALWTEQQTISLDSGFFSAQVGSATPLTPTIIQAAGTAGTPLYLGITVNTDVELSPRQPLLTVPYAFVADTVTGDITPNSVSVGGTVVIGPGGTWVGPSAGLQGPTGPQGPPGAAGAVGTAGPGSIGPTGPAGPDVTGSAGPQGPPGSSATGGIGPTGTQGPNVTGGQGAKGPLGPTGPAGIQAGGATYPYASPGAGTTVYYFPVTTSVGASTHCQVTSTLFASAPGAYCYIYPAYSVGGTNGVVTAPNGTESLQTYVTLNQIPSSPNTEGTATAAYVMAVTPNTTYSFGGSVYTGNSSSVEIIAVYTSVICF